MRQFDLSAARLILTMVVAASVFLTTACAKKPPTSETGVTKTADWLVVPIFFITNRMPVPDALQVDYLEEPNPKGVLVGVKNVVIPVPKDVTIDEDIREKMGWKVIRTPQPVTVDQVPAVPAETPVATRHLTREEILSVFGAYRESSQTDEMVFFVHGCCVTFDKSLERAATMAIFMRCPVVLYNWVSPTGFTRYLENETRLDQTLDGFYKFLCDVETMVPAENITLVGHSMGVRFIESALVRRFERLSCLKSKSKFSEVVMANADTDARSFLNHNREFTDNSRRTRIYMSTEDDRLVGSAVAHGGFERLGQPGNLLPELCRNRAQDLIDITGLGSGHNLPYAVVADMHHTDTLAKDPEFSCETREPNLFVLKLNKGGAAR